MKKIIESLIKGYEDRFGRAFILIISVFVALVPAVVLFYGLSSTAIVDIRGVGYIITLSGPAALFGLLYWYMTKVIFPPVVPLERRSVRGTVYLDNHAKEGVTVYADGDNRTVTTSYTGFFELELNSSQSSWTIVARYQDLSVKKQIKSNQLSVPLRLELKKK